MAVTRPKRIVLFRDNSGEWRWHAVARNGRKLADSGEGYVEYRDCFGTAWALFGDTVEYDVEQVAP